ncbi:hypothetical protein TKK_0018427 [Trichogramma kaykai]
MPSPSLPVATYTKLATAIAITCVSVESPSLRGSAATVSLLPVEQFQRKLHSRSVKNLSVPVLKPTVAIYTETLAFAKIIMIKARMCDNVDFKNSITHGYDDLQSNLFGS